jgi:SWI/SNF chromatin-remodeling complex subunit SWI1
MASASPKHSGPLRRRVEYRPLLRELDSDGGRDISAILADHRRLMGGGCRSIEEWGVTEIDALTMSIRSRLSIELSYALTTLTIFSIMRNGRSGFPIAQCPDLLDEMLDLAEEVAFGEDIADADLFDDEREIITHKQLVTSVLDDGNKLFAGLDERQQEPTTELKSIQRPADILLAIVNVLRNLSVVADNVEYLARHERVLVVCMRLCGLRRDPTGIHAVSPVLSLTDLATIRRDTLYMLVNFGNLVSLAPNLSQPPTETATRLARRVFDLTASYVLEPGVLSPTTIMVDTGARPPSLADTALEVFTRFSLPDPNRKVISRTVPEAWQRALFTCLVHRMPLSDTDFQILREESWLCYIERVIMALFTLAFLARPALKAVYRTDRTLGVSRVFLRLVKKFTINVPQNVKVFWPICAKRAIETLKVLDDGTDPFESVPNQQGSSQQPVLAFGMGYGDAEADAGELGSGMLSGFQQDILWSVMLQKEVGQDEWMFHELESLARVGMPIAA